MNSINTAQNSLPNNLKGLSLIELLVALSISSLLVLGVSNLYFNSRQTDQFTYELSRIQEVGRVALDFLARDIRMAGYQGCLDPATVQVNIIADNPPTTSFFDTAIRGFETHDSDWESGDTELNNSGIEALNISGSDVLAIQGASIANTELTGNMGTNNANIQITANPMGFAQDDVVVIADCQNADMFRISNNPSGGTITLAHANNVNTTPKLSKAYQTDAQVMFFESVAYFVGNTGRTSEQGHAINALYRYRNTLNNSATPNFLQEELVSGIDSMQMRYGERLASGNFKYVTADDVTNWLMVESIQIGLLVSGDKSVTTLRDNKSYELPGETIEPAGSTSAEVTHNADRRLRKAFNVTVSLRNRRTS